MFLKLTLSFSTRVHTDVLCDLFFLHVDWAASGCQRLVICCVFMSIISAGDVFNVGDSMPED